LRRQRQRKYPPHRLCGGLHVGENRPRIDNRQVSDRVDLAQRRHSFQRQDQWRGPFGVDLPAN